MNKKKLIQYIVIIACFAGSAYVLYNGFFGQSSQVSPITINPAIDLNNNAGNTVGASGLGATEKLLPNGEKLDFNRVLNRSNLQFGVTGYPVLNGNTDVGIPESQLILPPPQTPSQ